MVILTLFLNLQSIMLQAQCDPACEDLSNLTATAIYESLVPAADTVDLGSSGANKQFRHMYMKDETDHTIMYYGNLPFLHIKGGENPFAGDFPENVFLGMNAGQAAGSTNNGCVGIGDSALHFMSKGSHNTAIGWQALNNLNGITGSQGEKNTLVGSRAGELISTGSSNIGIGQNVFYKNGEIPQISGNGNIAIGAATTTIGVLGSLEDGANNISIGRESGLLIDEGDENIVLGYQAGQKIQDGNNNILIGSSTGSDATDGITSGSDNILIGNGVNASTDDANGELNIGNLLYGNLLSMRISIGNATPANTFNVGANDEFQVSSSGDLVRINDVAYSWPDDDGSTGHFLQSNGSGDLSWAAGVNIQVFTGTTTLWAKPDGAQTVTVICIGGGGGGGSGGIGNDMSGGAGGGAGGVSEMTFQATALSSYVVAYAGPGGEGGDAVSSGDGNDGTNGSKSSFGAYLKASGGGGGNGGSSTGAAGGSGGPGLKSNGGSGADAEEEATGDDAGNSHYASLGGGAGGGLLAGTTAYGGGDGGGNIQFMNSSPTAGAGGTSGGNGGNGTSETVNNLGTGGGGGAASASATAGNGGNGANYGAGGGGGGAATSGQTSGAGGDGANGLVIVISYL